MALDLEQANTQIGQEIGLSDWLELSQERISQFADVTLDHQWIHLDEERAKRESPYDATIAHGFLTLSMLSALLGDMELFPEGTTVINYGLDKVRFLSAVKSGQRIRCRAVLHSAESKAGGLLLKLENLVEIEGEAKPAMMAESLVLLLA